MQENDSLSPFITEFPTRLKPTSSPTLESKSHPKINGLRESKIRRLAGLSLTPCFSWVLAESS